MEIDSEPASGEFDVIAYGSTMIWKPPHDSEPVTSDERARIQENIAKELSSYRILWK